jgi:hypothetical protein
MEMMLRICLETKRKESTPDVIICTAEQSPYTKYVCIMTHYAKDDKAYAAPEFRTVGEPLPQSPRSSLTQPLPDPLAHQRR